MNDPNSIIYLLIFLFSLILTILCEKLLIPRLKRLGGQPIYTEGPSWHSKKGGTPTMGGVGFITAMLMTLIPAIQILNYQGNEYEAISLLLCIGYATANSLIGVIDDLRKLSKKKNMGLRPYQKLILQTATASAFLYFRNAYLNDTVTGLDFAGIKLGFFYYPISLLILVGITNFANLTDGIDGLASGVALGIGISMFYVSYSLSASTTMLCAGCMGALLGFLIFNIHPAKIFMGDTGSLFLGALTVGMVYTLGSPILLLPVFGIYIAEGASVIIQVLIFKLTKKRVFKMAPLHHHLEKCGWSENRICITAIVLTVILSLPAYILYLP